MLQLFELRCCLDLESFLVGPGSVLCRGRQGGVTPVLRRWMGQQRRGDNRDFGCLAPCLSTAITWAPWETSGLLEDRCISDPSCTSGGLTAQQWLLHWCQ